MPKPAQCRPTSSKSAASTTSNRVNRIDYEKTVRKTNEAAWKLEQNKSLARYYNSSNAATGKYGDWTAPEYYERMNTEAKKLANKYNKDSKLNERQTKLRLMLFKENQEYSNELKQLSSMPKYFKNGSYICETPTNVLKNINQGIKEKENQMRKQEAELLLHHQWRARQPAIREAERTCRNGALKSAWREQVVQQAITKQKEEEEMKRSIKERDTYIKKQLEIETENMKEKDVKMKELREYLMKQIEELKISEMEVKKLRKEEERENMVLENLQQVSKERKNDADRLAREREASIVNLRMHKHNLRKCAIAIEKDIESDLIMLKRLEEAVLNDYIADQTTVQRNRSILDEIKSTLQTQKEIETKRQQDIEDMFDGEARLMNAKQEKIWQQEREARTNLMNEVVETLKKQIDARLNANCEQQRENILERERMLLDIERVNQEIEEEQNKKKEQLCQYGKVTQLQTELQQLKVQEKKLQAKQEQERALTKAVEEEERLKKELIRVQRDGCGLPFHNKRKMAWIP